MSTPRSGSKPSRPLSESARLSGGNVRPVLASILHHPTASTTAVPTLNDIPKAERSLSFPNASPKGKPLPHHNPSRIIKTFDEVEVTKIVMAEEWYEELECGICSQVLGSAMSLVPCGHTFCGPCTWHWIKTNKNSTCPHCRVQVPTANPFIPNIIVDQVIERKLRALPESKERKEMIDELRDKVDEWKIIQAAHPPPKAVPPKRGRSFEDFLNLVAPPIPDRQEQARRRASANIHELGPPIPGGAGQRQRSYADMSLVEIHRSHAEEDALLARAAATAAEVRRLREINQRQGMALAALTEADNIDVPAVPPAREQVPRQRQTSANSTRAVPLVAPENGRASSWRMASAHSAAASRASTAPVVLAGRAQPARASTRPSILANRQARGRETGSRESPLVVSDSE